MQTRNQNDITPEEIIDLPIPDHVRISPSQKQVVWSAKPRAKSDDHEESTLWLGKVGQEDSARQLTSGLFNDRLPQWCPKADEDEKKELQESIAFVSDRAKKGDSCAIYLMRTEGGEPYPITATENRKTISIFVWSPQGDFIAFTSPNETTKEKEERDKNKDDTKVWGEQWEFNRLRLLHMSSREVITLYQKDRHVTAIGWSPDSQNIALVSQSTTDFDAPASGVTFEIMNLARKSVTHLLDFTTRVSENLVWIDDSVYYLASANPDAYTGSSAIYKVSIADSRWKRISDSKSSCMVEIRGAHDALVCKELRGPEDLLQFAGEKRTNIFSLHNPITSWDTIKGAPDRVPFAVVTSSAERPSEVYTNQPDKAGTVKISRHAAKLHKGVFGEHHALEVTSADGNESLYGSFVKPKALSHSSEPLPTLVFIHGGPYSRKTDDFDVSYYGWIPYLLASKTCGVLVPNYRGGSSQGERFAAYARGGMGTVDYDDVLTLVQEGIKKGFVDKERIIFGGWSQGGFLSYLGAVRNGLGRFPKEDIVDIRIRGAICGAGVSDWDMMCMTSDATAFEAELAGTPPWKTTKDDTGARRGSAIWEMRDNAKNVPPILILHGESDERVPLTQAVAFHRGCLHYNIPCEFVSYPREPHQVKERAHLLDMMKRVKRFCDINLI